jgi:hypothetical protein
MPSMTMDGKTLTVINDFSSCAGGQLALGVRIKSGWAALVLMGGTRSAPVVLDTRRVELADPATPASTQPHHAGAGTPQTDARVLRRLVTLIERCAHANVAALLEEYRAAGWFPGVGVVVGTSATDPDTITNPHIRIHALEGHLFRRVAGEALAGAGLRIRSVLERELVSAAPAQLGYPPAQVTKQLAKLRPPAAGPWRHEQKMAALAAWLQLSSAGRQAARSHGRLT